MINALNALSAEGESVEFDLVFSPPSFSWSPEPGTDEHDEQVWTDSDISSHAPYLGEVAEQQKTFPRDNKILNSAWDDRELLELLAEDV